MKKISLVIQCVMLFWWMCCWIFHLRSDCHCCDKLINEWGSFVQLLFQAVCDCFEPHLCAFHVSSLKGLMTEHGVLTILAIITMSAATEKTELFIVSFIWDFSCCSVEASLRNQFHFSCLIDTQELEGVPLKEWKTEQKTDQKVWWQVQKHFDMVQKWNV